MRDPVKLSYGLGVDSTAIIVGYVQRGLPIDAILFADTGSEKTATYAYLDVINEYLARHGYPLVTIVKNASPIAGDKSLHEECLRKSMLPAIAYGGHHTCSIKWKIKPQEKWVKNWTLAQDAWQRGGTVVNLIGYDCSTADLKRSSKAHGKDSDGHRNVFPLQEWGWDRARCEAEIAAAGLPVPPKSSCFMCSAMKVAEIVELAKTDPHLAVLAMRMESRARDRGLNRIKGLGRRFAWTDVLANPSSL